MIYIALLSKPLSHLTHLCDHEDISRHGGLCGARHLRELRAALGDHQLGHVGSAPLFPPKELPHALEVHDPEDAALGLLVDDGDLLQGKNAFGKGFKPEKRKHL